MLRKHSCLRGHFTVTFCTYQANNVIIIFVVVLVVFAIVVVVIIAVGDLIIIIILLIPILSLLRAECIVTCNLYSFKERTLMEGYALSWEPYAVHIMQPSDPICKYFFCLNLL